MIVSLYYGLYVGISSNWVSRLSSVVSTRGVVSSEYCIVRLLFQKVLGLVLRSMLGAFQKLELEFGL